MSCAYRISIEAGEWAQASAPPPLSPTSTRVETVWSFGPDELARMPDLRRWIASQGFRTVEERGYAKLDDGPDTASLARLLPRRQTDAQVLSGRLGVSEACDRCGLSTSRLDAHPRLRLDRNPGEGGTVTGLPSVDALVVSRSALNSLRAAGLDRGLGVVAVEAPGEPHVAIFSEVPLGEPAAPYGTTGERCRACGRLTRRTRRGRPGPALPRYARYLVFERPEGHPQWVWEPIAGPTWPMVTLDVARWLYERDPALSFSKHGWSPAELDQAFLPEEYR